MKMRRDLLTIKYILFIQDGELRHALMRVLGVFQDSIKCVVRCCYRGFKRREFRMVRYGA